jgi:hypothetical protein
LSAFWLPRPSTSDLHPAVRSLSNRLAVQHFGTTELNFEEKLATDLRAQTAAERAINSGAEWVLNALRPEILSVISLRPQMSILLVQQILSLAEKYDQRAVAYSMQALATEAIGFLNIIARGQPEDEARILRDALFTGTSLPDAFSAIGVPKSAHRRLLQPIVFRDLDLVPDPPRSLNDLPLSGKNFLTAMRLQHFFPLHGRQDFADFSRMVEMIVHLELEDGIVKNLFQDLFSWCLKDGRYSGCVDLLQNLMKRAQTMVRVTRSLTQQDIPIETALSEILAAKKSDGDPRLSKFACYLAVKVSCFWIRAGKKMFSIGIDQLM